MDIHTLAWIVIAALIALAVLVIASRRMLEKRHRAEADRMLQASQREEVSDEAAADARSEQAQAKAVIVARLRRGAATRRKEALAEINDEHEPTTGRQRA